MVVLLALSLLQAAPQEDRARILGEVEAWYKVVQDGKNVGYAHEKLERASDLWTYGYRADFEVKVKDGWHLEYREVEATLDENMAPSSLSARIDVNDAVTKFTILAEGEKRTLLFGERKEVIPAGTYAL